MSQTDEILAWINGTGPRPQFVAANADPKYVANIVHNFGAAYAVTDPQVTESQWWTNTASVNAAPDRDTAQQQLTAYITGTGPKPAWLADVPPSQAAGVEAMRASGADQTTAAGWAGTFLSSGVNSGVYRGGAAYQSAQGQPPPPGAPAAQGGTGLAPVQGSGVTDPYQPVGAGFGTDYGLPTGDPNGQFAGNVGPNNPNPTFNPQVAAAPLTGSVTDQYQQAQNPALTGAQTNYQAGAPQGWQALYSQPTQTYPAATAGGDYSGAVASTSAAYGNPAPTAIPTLGNTTTAPTGQGTADQRNALATIQQTLNTYGLGSLSAWAWQEIVNGASADQVALDLMQTPEFKATFPEIAARQQAGLPALSPADIVNYRTQATQIMKAAGLPAGFWDQPGDFTSLLEGDVSLAELNQRVSIATQAAYQVPADVRATLARDYGVGPGQLAAFFLDPKTAEPLIQRDFMAAQIGGAAYRTGYGSTKTQDETLTDLGVNPAQAQQGFNQLVQQRQLFSSLPGENTTGISRGDQLAAQFGGNSLAQEQIQRRAETRVAAFAGGGQFSNSQSGFGGIGSAQGS